MFRSAFLRRFLLSIQISLFISPAWLYSDDRELKISGENYHVTIINSYHQGNPWTDSLVNGEKEAILGFFPDTSFLVEYLDLKRFPRPERFESLRENLAYKNESFQTDLVLVNDNQAYQKIIENRDALYPETPIVFAGINEYGEGWLKELPPLVTGVMEKLNFQDTINTALTLQPDARKVYVVLDRMPSSLEIKKELMSLASRLSARADFIFMDDRDFPEIQEELSRLADDSLVLLAVYNKDRDGTFYDHVDAARLLSRASAVPVYYVFSIASGEGVVGGFMLDGRKHGEQAGILAARVLSGEPVSRIDPVRECLCPPVFDYRIMKKWGLSLSLLPEDAQLINQPFSSFHENRLLILHLAGALVLLVSVVIFLGTHTVFRNKKHKVLLSSEEDLRVTLNSIGDGVIASDNHSRITRINREAEKLTGWAEGSALGKSLSDVFRTKEFQISDNRPLYQSESGQINHSWLQSQNGREYPITKQVTPIKNDRGHVLGSVLIFRDITEENELFEQLRQSEKMNAIGQLAGGVAHDFNNMLSGILGSAELLEEYVAHEPNGEMLRTLIVKSSERAARLTRKLLAFARKSQLLFQHVQIHGIIRETVAILENTLDKRIVIRTDLEAEGDSVLGDNLQLQNALMNMGINSSQAIEKQGFITFSTKTRSLDEKFCSSNTFDLLPGEYIEIEISDNGCGISPRNIYHIFEPFFTTNKKHQGTGLGLAAVYGTVEQHKGSITVASREGEGTSFCILLPLINTKKPGKSSPVDKVLV